MNLRQDIVLDNPLKLGDMQMQSVSGVKKKQQKNLKLGSRAQLNIILASRPDLMGSN